MRAFKPNFNIKRAICWFCWELTISNKQKQIIWGPEKKEKEEEKEEDT